MFEELEHPLHQTTDCTCWMWAGNLARAWLYGRMATAGLPRKVLFQTLQGAM